MGKLFRLKEWLRIEDAAKHLSAAFGEQVTAADVMQFGLEGHLTLSVHLVNGARARYWFAVEHDAVEWDEFPGVDSVLVRLPRGGPIMQIENGPLIQGAPGTTTLEAGIWDLPLIGAEGLDVAAEYQRCSNGPPLLLQSLDGVFVQSRAGGPPFLQLLEDYEKNEHQDGSIAQRERIEQSIATGCVDPDEGARLLRLHAKKRVIFLEARNAGPESRRYYPAGRLPDDSVIVVRTASIRKLEESVENQSSASISVVQPAVASIARSSAAETNRQNTLLSIIAALLDQLDIDPSERSTARRIEELTEHIGSRVDRDTVKKYLDKIPELIDRHLKKGKR